MNKLNESEGFQKENNVINIPQIDNQIERYIDNIGTLTSSGIVLGSILIILSIWRNVIEPIIERQSYKLTYSLSVNNKIFGLLGQIMGKTNADRAIILTVTEDRRNKTRYQIVATHEVVESGLSYCVPKLGSINSFCAIRILDSLSTTDAFVKRVTENTQTTQPDLYDFLKSMGVGESHSYLIKRGDTPLAVLVIHYCNSFTDKAIEPRIIQDYISELRTILFNATNNNNMNIIRVMMDIWKR